MGNLFYITFVQPIFNLLIFIYNILPWPDIGMATIILTIIIRLILAPLFYKSTRQQLIINQLQPTIKKIQKEYKDNAEKLAKAQMELYSQHKVNPFGSCFISLIQLPIILAVYRVFLMGFSPEILQNNLYSFVNLPQNINPLFLGIVDLNKPNIFLAIISAVLQYISTKLSLPSSSNSKTISDPSQKMANVFQKQMVFIGPAITFIILLGLPSNLGLYWSITTLFSITQQWFIKKNLKVEEKIETVKDN
jgi:YidC/Oxa1 family membrane protein insertase